MIMKPKIGIVGLGIMGSGMANNFLKKGYSIFVWNRTRSASTQFVSKRTTLCASPKEVAQQSDIVFEITANDQSSQRVWMGTKGILAGAKSKTILIASATLSVEWIDALVDVCKKRKLIFLDIALTGGRIGAETGTLSLLCGGKEKVLKKIQPILRAIATKIFHFGLEGHGMRYKLILNFLQAVHVIGFGQAMKIAKSYNMNLHTVSEALADRPGGVVTSIARKMYFEDPSATTFSIEWMAKDLGYAKKMAKNLNVNLLDTVLLEYKKAIKNGFAQKDWARINILNGR